MTPVQDQADRLPGALRALWPNLPVVAACGVLVCAAFLPAVVLGAGLTPAAPLIAALCVGPAWAGVVAVADRVARGEDVELRDLVRSVRRYGLLGARVAVPAAVCATCSLVTLAMWQQTRSMWLAVPLAVGAAAAVLSLLASVPAYPLAVRAGLRGRDLWVTALESVAAAPFVALGTVAGGGLGLYLLGVSVSASLLLLVPGPLAVVLCAATPDRVPRLATGAPHPDRRPAP